jgi:hypothetical protein
VSLLLLNSIGIVVNTLILLLHIFKKDKLRYIAVLGASLLSSIFVQFTLIIFWWTKIYSLGRVAPLDYSEQLELVVADVSKVFPYWVMSSLMALYIPCYLFLRGRRKGVVCP